MSQKELKTEIVVVGGGAAGLPAAIAAKERGVAEVILLEKRNSLGGNASMAWGLFATESTVQKHALVEARSNDLFHTIMDWAHWSIEPRIVRALIDKSGDTISWLEDKGISFELLRYYPNQSPPVWHIPEGRGAQLMKALSKNSTALGVQAFLNTGCKKITRGSDGSITGIVADEKGREIFIKTKSVIIATGGYAGNEELLKKYCDYYDKNVHRLGLPHTGDGLQMAIEAGAATEGLGHLHLEWPNVQHDPGAIMSTIAREPYTVYVNKAGMRFIDETRGLHAFECANAILRQPDKLGYILIDDEMRRNLEERGAILGRGANRAEYRRSMPGLKEDLQSAANKDEAIIKISDSWDDIAIWIGTNLKTFRKTLDEYNSACDQGSDRLFAKDPQYLLPLITKPFYAIKGSLIFLQTIGGIKVSENMEVLDQKGSIIPGLYAAGADTSGWEPDTYCDKLSGAALGFSINSGRIAGEVAAKYVLE